MKSKLSRKADSATAPKAWTKEPERPCSGPPSVIIPKLSISRRLHRKQTAAYLGVSLSWLDKSRLTGLGPVFITIGGRIVYDSADLDAFLQSNRRTSTSAQH